ncbi:hypothetical protein D3C84_194130 [compost metagenome]
MFKRLVLHGPDFAARDRRSGFFNIGREHDCAGCAPGSAHDDVVVRIGIEKDAGAIKGIQPAVHAIERCAGDADEADIGNACSRVSGDGECIAASVANGTGIATQGRARCGTCPQSSQSGSEGRRQGRHQNIVVVSVPRRGWRGSGVLQPGRFVQRHVLAGRHDAQNAVRKGRSRHGVVTRADYSIGARRGRCEQKRCACRVVGIHVPRSGDAAVDLAVEIASAAVGHGPGLMPRAGVGVEHIVGRAPHTIRASTDGVVHFECHGAAGGETAGRDDGRAAGGVVFKVGGDGRNVGKSPVVADG